MSTPVNDASRTFPTIPRGEVIGRYENYLDAQKVVDYLADNDFPVANVSIIGNDLKLVERVRAKLSYPRVAGQGALQGAVIGLFFGLLLFLFSQAGSSSIVPTLASMLLGAVLFMLMSVTSYALQRGKRDFASTRQVLPSTWDVIVDPSVAGQAKALAAKLPMHPSQAVGNSGWGAAVPGPGAGATVPQPQSPVQPTPAAGSKDQGAPAASGGFGYDDLDDGRPRYGVRLDDLPAASADPAAAVTPAAQGGGEPPAHEEPARPQFGQMAAEVGTNDTATGEVPTSEAAPAGPSGEEAPQLSRREARALQEREEAERAAQERTQREGAERERIAREQAGGVQAEHERAEGRHEGSPAGVAPTAGADDSAQTMALPVSGAEARTQALPVFPPREEQPPTQPVPVSEASADTAVEAWPVVSSEAGPSATRDDSGRPGPNAEAWVSAPLGSPSEHAVPGTAPETVNDAPVQPEGQQAGSTEASEPEASSQAIVYPPIQPPVQMPLPADQTLGVVPPPAWESDPAPWPVDPEFVEDVEEGRREEQGREQ